MMKVSKQHLKGLIEPFIYDKLEGDEFEVVKKDAVELLTWNRLDLAFKLFYLDLCGKNNELAERVYKQDIRAQTLDSFKEFGDKTKVSFEKYLQVFNELQSDFMEEGFDSKKSYIPLSEEDTIENGAHRTALAIHQNKTLECVKLKRPTMVCDYNFFHQRCVSEEILDIVATKFIEYADNTYIAFLWPSGKGFKEEVYSKFTKVVYKKEIQLNSAGAFNLLFELYSHMEWIGTKKNGYQGIQQKLTECFPQLAEFSVIVFQSSSIEQVRELKDQIRNVYNIGFSSVHITDTKEEAIRISRLLFNKNGRHFLNYAKPHKYSSFSSDLNLFKQFLLMNKISTDDIVLDSGMTLSAYGIRESKDVDYLINKNVAIKEENNRIDSHDDQLMYHKENKVSLIYDPSFYFSYKNIKFLSFKQVYEMKVKRNEEKDKNDIRMMESLIDNNELLFKISSFKQKALYSKIKIKIKTISLIVNVLKKVKLYKVTRSIYHRIRK